VKAPSRRCREERQAVTASLKGTGGSWTAAPPEYDSFSRAELSKKLEQVRDAVLVHTAAPRDEVEDAYQQSQTFIDSAFDFYEGHRDLGGKIGRAFVVPMRSNRVDESYASESTPFYPLLDPHRFGVTSEIRMRAMYGVPPTVLDTYLKSDDNRCQTGALVLSPVYADMAADIWNDLGSAAQARDLAAVTDRLLAETIRFAHLRLGADFIGLGAILPHPNLTNFGRKFRALAGMQDLTTTTGHGGTVYMIARTAQAVISEISATFDGRIGVLGGAGSIGWSSIQTLHEMVPATQLQVFDKRIDRMRDLFNAATDLDRVTLGSDVRDILINNRVVVSAITDKIDLDAPEYADIDFQGTVWIDDSQPGSVDREQLESRGGKVIWVAGIDESRTRFMTRDGYHTNGSPYDYGTSSGLFGGATEFACGLEAAVVAASGCRSNAVTGPVRCDDARKVGRLFAEFGVGIAPFQSFGKPVTLTDR
jgi:hypothetical protein